MSCLRAFWAWCDCMAWTYWEDGPWSLVWQPARNGGRHQRILREELCLAEVGAVAETRTHDIRSWTDFAPTTARWPALLGEEPQEKQLQRPQKTGAASYSKSTRPAEVQPMDARCWLHQVHFGRKRRPKPWLAGSALPPGEAGVERQQALLQLAKRAGDGKLLSQKEHESSSSSQQLSLDKENLVWNGPMETLALAPLLLADLVYAPVTQRQKMPSATHIVVLAPRRKGEAQREVWLLCVVAKTAQLQGLLGQLARRGCLRWDLQDCFKISKACQGAGGQGAVFSGMNLFPMEPPRLLPESSDMISLSCTHDYTDIAAKVWNKDCEASIRNEVSFLQQSGGHPNISVLLGLFCAESPGGRLRWALIMELCPGGDVHQHAHGNGINPHNAIEVLFGVLSALIHLHTLRIVHRDVKSENVIINCDHAVLVDFGIAAFLDDPVAMKACVGSPGYAAPEVG
eukprot:symbB.v1.2.010089.t1/scaffold644.1/size179742/13